MEMVFDKGLRLRRCCRDLGALSALPAVWTGHNLCGLQEVRCRAALQEADRQKDQLLARAQAARAEAETAQRRLAFLAEASTWLTASLNYETTLTRLPRLVVPFLADWCAVYVTDSEPSPRLVAVAHEDPVQEEKLREMRRRYPLHPHALHPLTQVLRTGRPAFYPEVSEALLVTIAHDGWHLELLRALGLTAYMVVPLLARGRTFGAITLALAHASRCYSLADLALAEDLAHRVALALDNARLYREAQEEIASRLRAEEALRQARDELEWRVRERTAALVQANDSLRREIAERQQAEAQIRQQQDALAQREKLAAMGSLLAGVAHELNNPLAVVMMRADVLHEELQDGPLAEQAHAITQAAERCVHIVNSFLTLARQHPPERRPVQLNTVIEEVLQLLAYMLQVDDIAVELHLAPDLPTLWADAHQLHQVVLNLVTNAHQALREVPTPRRLTLTTRHNPAGPSVSLEVADTGPGIPPAIQARLFEPFFTTKPLGLGTGLGLPLCQGIIEGHDGTISLQSPPGHGTVFRIELPVKAQADVASQARMGQTLPVGRELTAAILVVDDEPAVVRALAHLLRRTGHEVDTAANGRLALEKLQTRAYDLILSDLRMPECDGPALYRELQHRHPQLCQRIIFLTGDTFGPEAQAFLEQVGTPRLTKPCRAAQVQQVVQQVLRALEA